MLLISRQHQKSQVKIEIQLVGERERCEMKDVEKRFSSSRWNTNSHPILSIHYHYDDHDQHCSPALFPPHFFILLHKIYIKN